MTRRQQSGIWEHSSPGASAIGSMFSHRVLQVSGESLMLIRIETERACQRFSRLRYTSSSHCGVVRNPCLRVFLHVFAVRLTPIKVPPSMRTLDIELYLFYFVEEKVSAWEKANTSENLSR